jgi:hypothetical protein
MSAPDRARRKLSWRFRWPFPESERRPVGLKELFVILLRKINHEETKSMKVFSDLFFAPFVSSWLILNVSGRRSAT